MINTKMKGDIAEAKVITSLLEKGFNVLKPFGDRNRYDLVYEKDKIFIKIQVKYLSSRNGYIPVRFSNCSTKLGKRIMTQYVKEDVDEFFIYCPDTKDIYVITIDDNVKNMHLRLTPTKNKQQSNIHYAEEFLF